MTQREGRSDSSGEGWCYLKGSLTDLRPVWIHLINRFERLFDPFRQVDPENVFCLPSRVPGIRTAVSNSRKLPIARSACLASRQRKSEENKKRNSSPLSIERQTDLSPAVVAQHWATDLARAHAKAGWRNKQQKDFNRRHQVQ